jgi:putative DNA primase/helicase
VVFDAEKRPYQVNGQLAKVDDRTTWTTIDKALIACTENGRFKGAGFVFTADLGFIAIDIDNCIDNGKVAPLAEKIIEMANSYTEISPSGTGIHIYGFGSLPDGARNKFNVKTGDIKCVEIYTKDRYMTVTGNIFGELKPMNRIDIRDIYRMAEKSSGKQEASSKNASGARLTEGWQQKIENSSDGVKFIRLFRYGELDDFNGDRSAADLSLCHLLAKHVGYNADVLDNVFRQSKLFRPKWDEKHSSAGLTYGQMTIEKVLKDAPLNTASDDEAYLRNNYTFRFNTITERIELWKQDNWIVVNDYIFNSIYRDMINKGSKITEQRLRGLLESDFVTQHNPFVEYFESLPAWDGQD